MEVLLINILLITILILSSIWAGIDSSKIELKKYKSGISYGPIVLTFWCLALWIVAFPWYLVVRAKIKAGSAQLKEGFELTTLPVAAVARLRPEKAKTKWSSCNLLEPVTEGSRLWQFSVSSKRVKLSGELRVAEGDDPPAKAVAKDWSDLLSRKLNIATLPPEKVFLRVVELPECEPDELLPMVEFQIEDLSPLPMAQAVWSAEAVPAPPARRETRRCSS